jgi:hypothetical protein
MEYVILIIVIAVLALGAGGWLLPNWISRQ